MNIRELEEKLGYKFKNEELLKVAMTHSSYANENKTKSYERLEFLGDTLLGLVTSEYLYVKYPQLPEGELTKMRSLLVCEKSLCGFSQKLDLGQYIYLSNGEIRTGGRERISILADLFEAIIAAMYVDGAGLSFMRKFILSFIVPAIANLSKVQFKDYKTTLQEIIQRNPEEQLSYAVVGESGPDHNKRFQVEVRLNSNAIGKGGGKSKKEAEQQAARVALELMGY